MKIALTAAVLLAGSAGVAAYAFTWTNPDPAAARAEFEAWQAAERAGGRADFEAGRGIVPDPSSARFMAYQRALAEWVQEQRRK